MSRTRKPGLQKGEKSLDSASIPFSRDDVPVDGWGCFVNGRFLRLRRNEPHPFDPQFPDGPAAVAFTNAMVNGKTFTAVELEGPYLTCHSDGKYELLVRDPENHPSNIKHHFIDTVEIKNIPSITDNTEERGIDNLRFVSVDADELPSYRYWTKAENERNWTSNAARVDKATIAQLKEKTRLDAEIHLDKERGLQELNWQNPRWLQARAKFALQLAAARRTGGQSAVAKIYAELDRKTQRLLEPTHPGSQRTAVEKIDSLKYRDNLHQRFPGVKDNATTKFAMASLGLPVEPLTYSNLLNIGLDFDDPPDEKDDTHNVFVNGPGGKTLVEKPLEWLDVYWKRSNGFPLIRVRKDTALTSTELASNAPPNLQAVAADGVHRHQYAQSSVTGGPEDSGNPAPKKGWVYCTYGKIQIYNSAKDLQHLIDRIFPRWREVRYQGEFMIDIIELNKAATPALSVLKSLCIKYDINDAYFKEDILPYLLNPEEYIVRIRYRGSWKDVLRSTHRLVRLSLRPKSGRHGGAFWRLPPEEVRTPKIEAYELGFRVAMEFLVENHVERDIQWELGQSTGRISLRHEAPSAALCNAIINTLKLEPDKMLEINIHLIEKSNKPPLLLLKPGARKISECPEEDTVKFIRTFALQDVLSTEMLKDKIFRVRAWPSPLDYAGGDENPHQSFSISFAEDDQSIRTRLGIMSYALLIVKPEFPEIHLCLQDKSNNSATTKTIKWKAYPGTLSSFFLAMKELDGLFDERKDLVSLRAVGTTHIFDVNRHTTEDVWRCNIFHLLGRRVDILINAKAYRNNTLEPLQEIPSIEVSGILEDEIEPVASPTQMQLPHVRGNPTFTPEWLAYMDRQEQQDKQRLEAFMQPQSTHDPRVQSVPLYGEVEQLTSRAGSSMPTVYHNFITPSEGKALRHEVRRLQNLLLRRENSVSENACFICQASFPPGGYKSKAAMDHFTKHFEERARAKSSSLSQPSRIPGLQASSSSLQPRILVKEPDFADFERRGLPRTNHPFICMKCSMDVRLFNTNAEMIEHVNMCKGADEDLGLHRYCGWPGCTVIVTPFSKFDFAMHYTRHACQQCPVPHCHVIIKEQNGEQLATHLRTTHAGMTPQQPQESTSTPFVTLHGSPSPGPRIPEREDFMPLFETRQLSSFMDEHYDPYHDLYAAPAPGDPPESSFDPYRDFYARDTDATSRHVLENSTEESGDSDVGFPWNPSSGHNYGKAKRGFQSLQKKPTRKEEENDDEEPKPGGKKRKRTSEGEKDRPYIDKPDDDEESLEDEDGVGQEERDIEKEGDGKARDQKKQKRGKTDDSTPQKASKKVIKVLRSKPGKAGDTAYRKEEEEEEEDEDEQSEKEKNKTKGKTKVVTTKTTGKATPGRKKK